MGASKFLVGVAAICLNSQNQILLLEHRFHNDTPWGLPGGWADRGENPQATALREVREETGLEAFEPKLVYVNGDGIWVDIVYACRVHDGEPVIQASELTGYCWVDPTNFDLNLKWTQKQAIARFVATM
ncbi:MAG: NUDIX hydrolase [Ardenticatenaceae bacterium]